MPRKVHEVTLRFPSAKHKEYFLGQLSDGWGENMVDLRWAAGVDVTKAKTVTVTNQGEYWEHHLRMLKKYPGSGL